MVTFPIYFCRCHQNLACVFVLNFCSWDDPGALRLATSCLLLPPASHITIIPESRLSRSPNKTGYCIVHNAASPRNRGFCDVVASLTTALCSMSSSPLPSSLTASFTFPRLLCEHIQFCKENTICGCSCYPFALKDPMVENVEYVEVVVDVLLSSCMVSMTCLC